MLHIKMPKGKVAAACERAADLVTPRIVAENKRYEAQRRAWHEMMKCNPAFFAAPPTGKAVAVLTAERGRLQTMADMAKHSAGDVYVSQELWATIKGVY